MRGVAAAWRAGPRVALAAFALRPLEARRTVAGTPRPSGHLRPNASYAPATRRAFDALLRAT